MKEISYAIAYLDSRGEGFTRSEPWIQDDFNSEEEAENFLRELVKKQQSAGGMVFKYYSDEDTESLTWEDVIPYSCTVINSWV